MNIELQPTNPAITANPAGKSAMELSSDYAANNRRALILAGGEGARLRPLTEKIAGRHIPKQFFPMVGDTTLLELTRRRVAREVPAVNTAVVVTKRHEQFYMRALADMAAENVIIQPEDKGTGAAILHSAIRLAEAAPRNSIAIFPSDHYVDNDEMFMAHVRAAFGVVEEFPDLIVLLGIAASAPEVSYGWIEPGRQLPCRSAAIFSVNSFIEKPIFPIASELLLRGDLWNSFVLVTKVRTLLGVISLALPEFYASFDRVKPAMGTVFEAATVARLYRDLPTVNFSHEILTQFPERLAVLPVKGVSWTDLGEPSRVFEVWNHYGLKPGWKAV